jgi:negative regulator of genetic competence, sporulation and motility
MAEIRMGSTIEIEYKGVYVLIEKFDKYRYIGWIDSMTFGTDPKDERFEYDKEFDIINFRIAFTSLEDIISLIKSEIDALEEREIEREEWWYSS